MLLQGCCKDHQKCRAGPETRAMKNRLELSVADRLSNPLTSEPSGEMTLEEFIEGAKDHEDIMDMLKKMMDLTPVLIIIVNGRQQETN